MFGQRKLINNIDSFTIGNLPHSILLCGEEGSEQEEVCKYVSDKFRLELTDITENINLDTVNEILLSTVLSLYVVDVSKITEREQNVLLKLYEEPSSYAYFILVSQSDDSVLETIKTRSYVINCDKYSSTDLVNLVKNKDLDDTQKILSVCHTPGQVEVANHTDIKQLDKICETIVCKMNNAPLFNALSVTNKINFKDEYDKFDLFLFIRYLKQTCLKYNNSKMYSKLLEFDKYIRVMNNKQQLFDNLIINLWECSLFKEETLL